MTPRCYAPEVRGGFVQLSADEAHHLVRVLRLGPGAPVVVFDGCGGEWEGTLGAIGHGSATVEALVARDPLPEPPVAVTLAIGLLKGDQMTAVVRDATALGVATIVPFASAHTARPASAPGGGERWERVAVAAAKQCGRSVMPAIEPCTTFFEVLERDAELRLTCVEPRKRDVGRGPAATAGEDGADWPQVSAATLFIGPEGGWSPEELRQLEEAGARRLDLGPRTLRAELAPAIALAVLWTRWGWRVKAEGPTRAR